MLYRSTTKEGEDEEVDTKEDEVEEEDNVRREDEVEDEEEDDEEDEGARARRVKAHGVQGMPVCPAMDWTLTVMVNAPGLMAVMTPTM
jgi:hypothetical protein